MLGSVGRAGAQVAVGPLIGDHRAVLAREAARPLIVDYRGCHL